MVEYNFEEKGEEIEDIFLSDAITGDRNKNRFLYYQLKKSFVEAEHIDIIVSFLMETGVKLLLEDLKRALDRGVTIRILTGNYLNITQPSALYLLKRELKDRVDLRFYNEKNRSFHAKAYIFHQKNKKEIYIGSSNISKSALTSGIEWNYRFDDKRDKKNFDIFLATFEDLFLHHSIIIDEEELKRYAKLYKKPMFQKELEDYEEEEKGVIEPFFQPRGVQIEALYALEKSREEGAKKGLVYAATGIGKTYLAAFDSASYQRVLFIAHREEILYQAAESFYNIRKSMDYGFFYKEKKCTDKSIIFASVSSLGKEKYLNEAYFQQDYFDYIIIDEFHHAVNEQYQRIIKYFKPKYLLGLTATPDRLDGRNIYELCDYIVPYQISLTEAINKGVLVSFRYYGIYDDTVNYQEIHLVKGRYLEAELNEKLLVQKRYELIYKHYKKYHSERALGFCCSRIHAQQMAEEFVKRGIKAVAVYSNAKEKYTEDRKKAIEKLKNKEIQVIFSVDMFNEGVDICAIDMVMFLRPTESPVIFLQQLGRGLRKNRGKKYLNVLDFIGNYKMAGTIPFLLSGEAYKTEEAKKREQKDFSFPDDCIVDFDMRLIDLFQEMAKRDRKKREMIQEEFYRIKEFLNQRVPTRMELFRNMEEEIYQICLTTPKENIFHNYLKFLWEWKELNEEEEVLYSGIGREFLHLLETTNMSKSYKMPILLAFYHDGEIKMEISEEDVYQSYINFYEEGINGKDLEKDKSSSGYKSWTKKRIIAEAKKNPIYYLKKSGQGFFIEKEGCILALKEELKEVIENKAFIKHMKDIISYRTIEYYRNRFYEK